MRHIVFFIGLVLLLSDARAQEFEGLIYEEGKNLDTYYSEGASRQAEYMSGLCNEVISFYYDQIGYQPKVTLLVLSPDDWSNHTQFPFYGMPHYTEHTLVVAAEDNAFWQSMLPPVNQLPEEVANQVRQTYTDRNDQLTMAGFFDLLAIHELGHAYHVQGGLNTQRLWMEELFANILLHTYIAEKRPQLLPALTVFPNLVVDSTPTESLKYTSLQDLEIHYQEITQQFPQNYGWYQCHWHKAAGSIYDEAGTEGFKKLWNTLKNQSETLEDGAFAKLLEDQVHPSVAKVPLEWNQN